MKPSMSYSGHVGTSNLLPAVGFMLIGALCSALLLFGLGARLHETPSATTSMVFVTSSSEMDPPIGGRLGGIDSSDTANDARTRAALNATMVVGGRLGGIISADAVVDFMTR